MFQGVTMLLAANEYLHAFVTLLWARRTIVGGIVLVCVVQIYTIIATRSHYTVDIVIACYTGILLWTVLWDRWPDSKQSVAATDSVEGNTMSNRTEQQCDDGLLYGDRKKTSRLPLIPETTNTCNENDVTAAV